MCSIARWCSRRRTRFARRIWRLRDSGSSDLDTLEIEHWERKLIAEALSRDGQQCAGRGAAAGHRPGDAVSED